MTLVPILAVGQATTLSLATRLVKLRLSVAMYVEISANHRLGATHPDPTGASVPATGRKSVWSPAYSK